jgi:hypothetical protein
MARVWRHNSLGWAPGVLFRGGRRRWERKRGSDELGGNALVPTSWPQTRSTNWGECARPSGNDELAGRPNLILSGSELVGMSPAEWTSWWERTGGSKRKTTQNSCGSPGRVHYHQCIPTRPGSPSPDQLAPTWPGLIPTTPLGRKFTRGSRDPAALVGKPERWERSTARSHQSGGREVGRLLVDIEHTGAHRYLSLRRHTLPLPGAVPCRSVADCEAPRLGEVTTHCHPTFILEVVLFGLRDDAYGVENPRKQPLKHGGCHGIADRGIDR